MFDWKEVNIAVIRAAAARTAVAKHIRRSNRCVRHRRYYYYDNIAISECRRILISFPRKRYSFWQPIHASETFLNSSGEPDGGCCTTTTRPLVPPRESVGKYITVVPHPPPSLLAGLLSRAILSIWFFSFPKIITDLERLKVEDFQHRFDKSRERWDKCGTSDGERFERDSYIIRIYLHF